MLNTLTFILSSLATAWMLYISYRIMKKSIENKYEGLIYVAVLISIFLLSIIYFLDRYNIPTEFGWYTNVNIDNWFSAVISYSNTIVSVFISSIVSMCVVIHQIKTNNELNIENQRIQNMPILKYCVDVEKKKDIDMDMVIDTKVKEGYPYRLNISIKNIGINSIKNIKVDFKTSMINDVTYRILGKNSLEVLESGEKLEINKYFSLKFSKEPYDISIIVYYEDILSNWYRQTLKVKYTATNVYDEGYVGIANYTVGKEEFIQEEKIESKVL